MGRIVGVAALPSRVPQASKQAYVSPVCCQGHGLGGWQMFKSRPPIGVDGHLLFPKDCSLRDVIEAVGMELSKEEGERLLKTMPPLPPIPANATP